MVPSSPIELGKCGTKISSYQVVMESMTSPTKWHQPHILMYKVDTFVMGDDWKGKFDSLTDICNVVYLPRTPEISTTKIKHDLDIIHQDTQS
jgi:glycerol-3-phosphate cytidylyltransferase-like family protein